jgi:hypothetical protein
MATSSSPKSIAASRTLQVARTAGGGGVYTITGTGFGTKQATAPTFDDFENLSLGVISASSVGSFIMSDAGLGGTSVVSAARDGNKCILNDFALSPFPKVYKNLAGTGKIGYMGCWIKRDIYGAITSSNNPVWKYSRVGSNSVYSGSPRLSDEYVGQAITSASGILVNSAGGTIGTAVNNSFRPADPITIHPENAWLFYELEYDYGTAGNNDCFFEVRINGNRAVAYYGSDGYIFLTAGSTASPGWLLTPMNGMGEVHPVYIWLDDVYADESRARAVLTDNAVYANSTKWAVQPIEFFGNASVTVTGKRQDFSVGAAAFLHLFNDNGALVVEGRAATVIEDAA